MTERVFTQESVTNDLRKLFVKLQDVEEEANRNKRKIQELEQRIRKLER